MADGTNRLPAGARIDVGRAIEYDKKTGRTGCAGQNGMLGIVTLLMAGYYREKSKHIHWLLITNGIVSLASVVVTVIDINWVMTTTGLVAYFLWNGLMISLMVLIYCYSKRLELTAWYESYFTTSLS